jgi:hypothetical protein
MVFPYSFFSLFAVIGSVSPWSPVHTTIFVRQSEQGAAPVDFLLESIPCRSAQPGRFLFACAVTPSGRQPVVLAERFASACFKDLQSALTLPVRSHLEQALAATVPCR